MSFSLYLRKYSSVLLFLVSLGIFGIFLQKRYFSTIGPILGGVFGSTIGILALFLGTKTNVKYKISNPIGIRIIGIVCSFYISGTIIMYRYVTYNRSIFQYALFAGFAGFIAYQIAEGERKSRILPQMVILLFFTYWSSQFIFPAGMYAPDTKNTYLQIIQTAIQNGEISDAIAYLNHMVYVTEFTLISNLSSELAYYLLATLVLTGTVIIIMSIGDSLPIISSRIEMYAALIFGVMSWNINLGQQPGKLNFFYALTVLIALVTIKLNFSKKYINRWLIIGLITAPAIIYGHRFSAGAVLVFLIGIGIFTFLSQSILRNEYQLESNHYFGSFVIIYIIGMIGNPLHQTPLLSRLTNLITSFMAPASTSAGAGPGRYSAFSIEFLIASTLGQFILFGLGAFGAILIFRRAKWEYDFIIFWMGILASLLAFGLLVNSRDLQPQRFYGLMGLFGLNICAGVTLVFLSRVQIPPIKKLSISQSTVVVIVISLLTIASFASPIAGMATSPFDDEIPHYRVYETKQLTTSIDWKSDYMPENSLQAVRPRGDIEIERTDPKHGTLNLSSVSPETTFIYSKLVNKTGQITAGGKNIGGANFVYVTPPSNPEDDKIYINGQSTVYVRNS